MAIVDSNLEGFEGLGWQESEEIREAVETLGSCRLHSAHISARTSDAIGAPSVAEPNLVEEIQIRKGKSECTDSAGACTNDNGDSWICAICMDNIQLEEFSQVKGCEHSYCITCVLRWASYKQSPWCPQCRNPFSMLYLYRTLDGSISDYMVEEPVCLLLCASWFKALPQLEEAEQEEDYFDADEYYEEEEDIRYPVRIGNRRWGEHGYVRGGRMEAVPRPSSSYGGASSSASRNKTAGGASAGASTASGGKPLGRRAKRAQQRQNAEQIASAKQQQRQHAGRR